MEKTVSCRTTPNIALVKYWGKRDTERNLPLNSSLSVTLADEGLHTTTVVQLSSALVEDEFYINGEYKPLHSEKKVQMVIDLFRAQVQTHFNLATEEKEKEHYEKMLQARLSIRTENSFPTASGLASSASGFSCLVKCLSSVFGVFTTAEEANQLNAIARMASGSACRSLYGGLVLWEKGVEQDGRDSVAHQVESEQSWRDLHVCICVVNEKRKEIGSTEGMARCVRTSFLLKKHVASAEARIQQCIASFQSHDFPTLSEVIMAESDDLHAICNAAEPPICYLSSESEAIQAIVRGVNEWAGRRIMAYSFDAGANAFLFFEEAQAACIVFILNHLLNLQLPVECHQEGEVFLKQWKGKPMTLRQFYHTRIGSGPVLFFSICSANKQRM